MRINHNIAALNTYRQMNSATTSQSKSMEKLSSGLRINRAGDDAAGLAISEKMRAQVRGLDQASANAQDGISMIQTAEGALNETHDILQRMRELANQAANDTNVNVDRDEIQKEMNQLTSEINRIGNTTEFNTQKMLNGGGEVNEVAINTMKAGAASGAFKGAGGASIDITTGKSSTAAVAAVWDSSDLTALTDTQSGSISFAGVTINVSADNGATQGISGVNQVGADLVIDSGVTTTQNDQAQLIVDAFNAVKAGQSDTGSLKNFTFSQAAGVITITGTEADGASNNDFALAATGDVDAAATPTTAGVTEVRGEYSFEIDAAFERAGAILTIAGEAFNAVSSGAKAAGGEFNVGTDKEQQAISLANAINANSTLNTRFDAIVDGAKIIMREKAGQATGVNLTDGSVTDNVAVQGKYSFNIDESVAVGGRYSVGGVNIEVTDDANNAGLAKGTAVMYSADKTQQASNLANAIASNSTLSENYTVEASSNRITLTQKAGQESMTAVSAQTSTNKNENFQANFQVGANSGQSMTIEVEDMRSTALGVSNNGEEKTITSSEGKVASYVQAANVTNGTDNVNVEFALDVSSHEKATAAISVINDSIERVSAERSKLGAFQNRLEHTINNLGTSSENLTAAESRVRDVDMAKEIMESTKNGILAQAAQAMMAQANSMPQGVLQLLR